MVERCLLCALAKEAKAAYGGNPAHGCPFIEFRFCGAQERKVGEEDVARHTHSARQTDDSEEDEKDHFETTKKNPKRWKDIVVSRPIDIDIISNPNHHHHHHRP